MFPFSNFALIHSHAFKHLPNSSMAVTLPWLSLSQFWMDDLIGLSNQKEKTGQHPDQESRKERKRREKEKKRALIYAFPNQKREKNDFEQHKRIIDLLFSFSSFFSNCHHENLYCSILAVFCKWSIWI
jgi:hypothetical protein